MKTVTERKFRRYETLKDRSCDKCGSKIPEGELIFRRSKYRILGKVPSISQPVCKILRQECLCPNCVPEDEILEEDR